MFYLFFHRKEKEQRRKCLPEVPRADMSFRQSWSSGRDYPLQYISAFSQQSVRLKLHQGERKKNKPNTEIHSIRISSLFQVDSMRLRVKKVRAKSALPIYVSHSLHAINADARTTRHVSDSSRIPMACFPADCTTDVVLL